MSKFGNEEYEVFITNLKANFFDILQYIQKNLTVLEVQLINAKTNEEKAFYEETLLKYRKTVNNAINSVGDISDIFVELNNCENEFSDIVENVIANNENVSQEVVSDEVVENPVIVGDESQEVASDEVIEDPVIVGDESQEVASDEVIKDPVIVGDESQEVASDEVIKDPVIVEDESQEVASDEVIENPVIVDDVTSDLGGMFADPSSYVNDDSALSSKVVINTPEAKDSSTEIELPSIDGGEDSTVEIDNNNEIDNNKDIDFISEADGKAIIVTESQAKNLRDSLVSQKELLNSTSVNQSISPDNIEEMTNKMIELYGQGKTEEAEKLSENISVLTKKLN